MRSSEPRQSRKALAALVGFVARGPVTGQCIRSVPMTSRLELERSDGTRRMVDTCLLKLTLERGLLVGKVTQGRPPTQCTYTPTPEGRAALRRWLCDPDSAFQDQHRALQARSDPDMGLVSVNARESPLAALARIKGRDGVLFLSPVHVEAGERLRIDFTRGQMQPSLGQSWEPVHIGRQTGGAGGVADITDSALAARLRVQRALAEVGPELSGVLVDVCCFLKRLAEVERERQWPVRSAKLMLRTALAALARHYDNPGRGSKPPPAQPRHAP
ncbi:hypothetical protein IMCC20628_02548 [Hoeflea sp. IMCC20628]|uniref:DUF6456 domain-containing protein n=1 Tax=Hoeflea sp. IMCC20628 TaxID=1620421 RepID=UPI00063BF2DB|nr:DUF6456 domain-containing protein [Hoeflea sp. IMCC20628]AKI01246.1 hypothetical protein IMCC20628_02548 [Hoeflea sp. IMCC20628]